MKMVTKVPRTPIDYDKVRLLLSALAILGLVLAVGVNWINR